MTNFYEFTYVLPSTMEDDERNATQKKFDEIITKNDGKIIDTEDWGLRSFSYEIKKQRSGYYINQYFEGPGVIVQQLEKALKIDEKVLRFLVLKYDNKMKKHYEMRKKGELPNIFAVENEEE